MGLSQPRNQFFILLSWKLSTTHTHLPSRRNPGIIWVIICSLIRLFSTLYSCRNEWKLAKQAIKEAKIWEINKEEWCSPFHNSIHIGETHIKKPGSCIKKILFYEVRHFSPNFHCLLVLSSLVRKQYLPKKITVSGYYKTKKKRKKSGIDH